VSLFMINPVSSATHHSHASQASKPAPQPPQPKPEAREVQDKVTLTKKADVDHDGDSK